MPQKLASCFHKVYNLLILLKSAVDVRGVPLPPTFCCLQCPVRTETQESQQTIRRLLEAIFNKSEAEGFMFPTHQTSDECACEYVSSLSFFFFFSVGMFQALCSVVQRRFNSTTLPSHRHAHLDATAPCDLITLDPCSVVAVATETGRKRVHHSTGCLVCRRVESCRGWWSRADLMCWVRRWKF